MSMHGFLVYQCNKSHPNQSHLFSSYYSFIFYVLRLDELLASKMTVNLNSACNASNKLFVKLFDELEATSPFVETQSS